MTSPLRNSLILFLPLSLIALGGCTATQTFSSSARAGDTVALAVGWNKKISRQDMTVTFYPSSGMPVSYAPNDPGIRAVINLYADPVSRLTVGTETGQTLGYGANGYGSLVYGFATNMDPDWYETVVFLDLPSTLPTGTTNISIQDASNQHVTPSPIAVNVLPGTGSSNPLQTQNSVTLTPTLLDTLERADNNVVTFSGATIPYSIQVTLVHTPGIGIAWVVNPRGDKKNIAWSDTNGTITAILSPNNGQNPSAFVNFKFYVAGGLTGLAVTSVKAYDISGNPVSGVTATVN